MHIDDVCVGSIVDDRHGVLTNLEARLDTYGDTLVELLAHAHITLIDGTGNEQVYDRDNEKIEHAIEVEIALAFLRSYTP